jgi:hypothetical protein
MDKISVGLELEVLTNIKMIMTLVHIIYLIFAVVFDKYFPEDKEPRAIFKITLENDRHKYSFKFGQSIAQGLNEPSKYDVLACLTKYEPETFKDFCNEYGYNEDSRTAEKTYKAVCKEYENVMQLWTEEERRFLNNIN